MTKSKNKNKDLKVRVSEDLFEELHDVTDNMSVFVREAIKEKIYTMQYSSNSTQSMRIKEIDLIIETKKSQINTYQQIIEREEKEIETLEAEKKRYEKMLIQEENNKEEHNQRLIKNPKFIKEMDENIKLILRKKYMHIEVSLNRTYTTRAESAGISLDEYKKLLLAHIDKEYYIGQEIKLSTEKQIVLTHEDIEYMKHRIE
jgi:hypothetical protein